MTQFSNLGLAEAILRAVTGEGYSQPTPIQAQVIPAMIAGHDVLGTAQTGTGKTASFVLPLLQHVAIQNPRPADRRCGALILVPTRELAAQVVDNIRAYSRFMKLSVAMVIGGAKAGPQIQALKKGVHILVATPGRLEDLMSSGDVSLEDTRTVILDEADQMLDFGFVPAIRRILKKIPTPRQTVLLSATMPDAIRALANDFLSDPKEIAVAPAAKPIDRIDQKLIHVEKARKRDRLVEVLSEIEIDRAVVFTRTKHGANKVTQILERAGLSASAIHGNKSQNQRQATLAGFRSGTVKILVATDIAARGIDVDGVSHVVNFELPNVPEVYVHRIGRTARAGKSGIAISLVDETESGLLRDIEKLIGRKIDAANDPVAPAQQQPASVKQSDKPKRNRRRRPSKAAKPAADAPHKAPSGDRKDQVKSRRRPNKPNKPQGKPRNGNEAPNAGLNRMFANIGTGK